MVNVLASRHRESRVHTLSPASPRASTHLAINVLLADADRDSCKLLQAALRHAGAEVSVCHNGASALRHLQETPPDLVITDVVLPKVDGLALADRATSMRPRPAIIFVTAFGRLARDAGYLPGDRLAIVGKPASAQRVIAEIQRLMANVKLHRLRTAIATGKPR
jgi:two-component system cell cycle response regulator CpdR